MTELNQRHSDLCPGAAKGGGMYPPSDVNVPCATPKAEFLQNHSAKLRSRKPVSPFVLSFSCRVMKNLAGKCKPTSFQVANLMEEKKALASSGSEDVGTSDSLPG